MNVHGAAQWVDIAPADLQSQTQGHPIHPSAFTPAFGATHEAIEQGQSKLELLRRHLRKERLQTGGLECGFCLGSVVARRSTVRSGPTWLV